MASFRFLFTNGVVLQGSDAPPVITFLESHPGAYTTTRTYNNASSIMFWDRHMKRLTQSVKILSNSTPQLLSESNKITNISSLSDSITLESVIRTVVDDSMRKVLPIALKERNHGEELAITVLVSVNLEKLSEIDGVEDVEKVREVLDVHVHVGSYVPSEFGVPENGANLAVVGRGRDIAAAKYSDWVRRRKSLEKLRPPSVTELLLSNDGDQILEGCLTNFFVVCRKIFQDTSEDRDQNVLDSTSAYSFELQTAPISDGVLTGVIRQLVIEACLAKGIPFREVAPTWSRNEIWEEAFVTNSLRIMEHVKTICIPGVWDFLNLKTWSEISWNKKSFKDVPGMITIAIQKEIMEKALAEGYPIDYFI